MLIRCLPNRLTYPRINQKWSLFCFALIWMDGLIGIRLFHPLPIQCWSSVPPASSRSSSSVDPTPSRWRSIRTAPSRMPIAPLTSLQVQSIYLRQESPDQCTPLCHVFPCHSTRSTPPQQAQTHSASRYQSPPAPHRTAYCTTSLLLPLRYRLQCSGDGIFPMEPTLKSFSTPATQSH